MCIYIQGFVCFCMQVASQQQEEQQEEQDMQQLEAQAMPEFHTPHAKTGTLNSKPSELPPIH